ncbi:unnamed protein product, partial [Choristocarpus tenellus]
PQTPTDKNKRYSTKMIFLAAMPHPRKFSHGVKIGIWPIVDTNIAQHSSKYLKGTKVHVPATVNGERKKKLMIEDIILAIKVCIPRLEGHTIFVHQDRAKAHTN